jgi:hypothetical protein
LTNERAASLTFAAAAAVALVMYTVVGRHNWFFLDEWDFLATRSLGSFDDLMRPHNEHWSTLPIMAYRVLWRTFGLRTYVPYVVLTILLHITAATLVRLIMRRAGVGPWLATAASGLFLFLGSGYQNIVWGFQIGFVGSLVCGLAHLLLADHDGMFDRRDVVGLAFGLAGLMCSGVSVPLVGAVGLAVLLRRGWRMALVHTVPLGVVFGAWYVAYGREGVATERPSVGHLLDFVWTAFSNAARSAGDLGIVTVALAAVLVVGAVLWALDRRANPAAAPRSWAAWALVGGALAFTVITGYGRVEVLGVDSAEASRYVHLLAAMLLPAVAVAAQAIVARWRLALPVIVVVLLAGIPGNVDQVLHRDTIGEHLLAGNRQLVEAYPTVDVARAVPRSVEPDVFTLDGVTIGWLLAARASGRLPDPGPVPPLVVATARTRLSVEQERTTRPAGPCRRLPVPVRRTLAQGDRIRFRGRLDVRLVESGRVGPAATYRASLGSMLVVRVEQVTIELARTPPTTRTRLC